MAFTRFYDDPLRISKRLEESTFAGRYQLDMPGPGVDMPFEEDPNTRLQKWGANLRTNTINLESDLRGMTRPLSRRDCTRTNNYETHAVQTAPMAMYSTANPYVEESRASHPAWMYRDLQPRWEQPLLNPQANLKSPLRTMSIPVFWRKIKPTLFCRNFLLKRRYEGIFRRKIYAIQYIQYIGNMELAIPTCISGLYVFKIETI